MLDHSAGPAGPLLSKYEPAAPLYDSAPLLSSSYAGKPYGSSAPILTTDDSVYPTMFNKGAGYAADGPLYDNGSYGLHKK
ncbi:hypothetical protein BLA29_014633 [Euroglyphus maynei]|uniref:Uncharacterized protein n=1 Tax=Euroglyphus maynei TaxID=6958 RepID=A0A1Y3AXZ3_EURMA|nr:hypothetical protein BLA29_014633 [Euroglyphus maynei]